MSNPMNIFDRISEGMLQFEKQTGQSANTVFLTFEDEREISKLQPPAISEELLSSLLVKGARKTFPKIHGLNTRWDQSEFAVSKAPAEDGAIINVPSGSEVDEMEKFLN